jgi:NTP pyrophosphatase (non-canonical NTP hydrolase)
MEHIYNDIVRMNKLDPSSPDDRLCKLYEEVGELAQAINKTIGRKKRSEEDTDENIKNLIMEECADTIQCVFSFCYSKGYEYNSLGMLSTIGNCKDNDTYGELSADVQTELKEAFINIGKISDNNDLSASYIISNILRIGGHYGITLGEIKNTILTKNLKWEKLIK